MTTVNAPETPKELAPSIEWQNVQIEDIPLRLLDKHPRVRMLTRRIAELEADFAHTWKALDRFGKIGSAIHSVIEPLEDVHALALAKLSQDTRGRLGIQPPASMQSQE